MLPYVIVQLFTTLMGLSHYPIIAHMWNFCFITNCVKTMTLLFVLGIFELGLNQGRKGI